MIQSIWTDSVRMQQRQKLNGDIKTEVLIIGGGMCGVLCGYYLSQMGIDYVLVEGKTIGSGITKNTTAKITCQHGLIYDKLIKDFGIQKAGMYAHANARAVERYADLCKNMDCGFERKSAFAYSLTGRQKLEDEVKAVNLLGLNAEIVNSIPLPFSTNGAVMMENQAQFNPLKFIQQLSKGLNIYENTFVKSIGDHVAITDNGKITAKKIIAATHFPFINKHGSYFLKMYQSRSYVIALEGAQAVNGIYIDEEQTGMSFRNYGELLLVGGGDHRTGKQGGNWSELRSFAKKHYPTAKERYAWSTQDCMSLDGVPYIGHYSSQTPDLFVATGFNKWGMSTSMVAAMILSDMVVGKKNAFESVFSPHRSILKPQLLVNGFEAMINLLTPSTKRCPHLGCALKWNRLEHSWDCPCHGSRFEKNGDLIDNPATGGINGK